MFDRWGDVVEVSTTVDPWGVLDQSLAPLGVLFTTCLSPMYISNFNSHCIYR